MQRSLFREGALENMTSPDELDRLMRVTDPRGWLALIALFALVAAALLWGIFGRLPVEVSAEDGILIHGDSRHEVVSQASGIVTHVRADTGDRVEEGQVVAQLRPDEGGEIDVVSLFDGRIEEVMTERGMLLNRGDQVAVVEKGNRPLEATVFVPGEQGKQLEEGMQVHVSPATVYVQEFGYVQGEVASVSAFPVTESQMFVLLQNQSLVDTLRRGSDQVRVDVRLLRDRSTPSGLKWSSSQGPPFAVTHGTLSSATFVLGERRPVSLVFPTSAG